MICILVGILVGGEVAATCKGAAVAFAGVSLVGNLNPTFKCNLDSPEPPKLWALFFFWLAPEDFGLPASPKQAGGNSAVTFGKMGFEEIMHLFNMFCNFKARNFGLGPCCKWLWSRMESGVLLWVCIILYAF